MLIWNLNMCFEKNCVKEALKRKIADNNGIASYANLNSADSNMLTYMREKE